MNLTNLSIVEFINEVDSSKPAPGGGSVSALASTLGVSLASMVSKLSVGKKKYEALSIEVKQSFEQSSKRLLELKLQLTNLIDEDTLAFNQMMIAYKMPKNNDNEILVRNEAIQKATIHGINIPLQVAKTSLEALLHFSVIIESGNKTALSDLGVGVLMMAAGIEGAVLNIFINLPGLIDISLTTKYRLEAEQLLDNTNQLKHTLMKAVHQTI